MGLTLTAANGALPSSNTLTLVRGWFIVYRFCASTGSCLYMYSTNCLPARVRWDDVCPSRASKAMSAPNRSPIYLARHLAPFHGNPLPQKSLSQGTPPHWGERWPNERPSSPIEILIEGGCPHLDLSHPTACDSLPTNSEPKNKKFLITLEIWTVYLK